MMRDIIDELASVSQRGDYIDNTTSNAGEITVQYQKLTIKVMFESSQANNLKDANAYFLWKN